MTRKPKQISKEEKRIVAETEFRKANESIGLRVVDGKFTLLARKIYNIFIAYAQEQGAPGANAPINTVASENYFWIPLSKLSKNLSYDSKDLELLKDSIHALEKVQVIGETDTEWTSERLVSSVKIVSPEGLGKRGVNVWLGYAFPPEVSQLVLSPDTYTKLSLYYQTLLRSAASLSLYEITRRYATSPSHLTAKKPWTWWYNTITGNPIKDKAPEYKYFKRDCLLKAIAEINSITDIEIELIEYRKARSISDLQFKVTLAKQASLEFDTDPPLIDYTIIERMLRFGVEQDDAVTIYADYDQKELLAAIELVEKRLASKKGEPLESPSAYFKTVLKKGYAKGSIPTSLPNAPKQPPAKPKKALRDRFIAARSKEAIGYHNELSKAEQDEYLAEFAEQADKATKSFLRKKGLQMEVVQSAYGQWLATRLWGEVTDTAILDFLESETAEAA